MSVNRYAASCSVCGHEVPARGGLLTRDGRVWTVRHLACAMSGEPEVVTFTDFRGRVLSQRNRRGLCEDAPCCGCCF